MKIEMILIGVLLFGLVFVLGYDIHTEMLKNYDVEIDTTDPFGRMSDNGKQIKNQVQLMRNDIQGGSVSEGTAEDDMIRGTYQAIKNNPFTAIGTAGNATETLMKETDIIPAEAIGVLLLILSILTIFAIIALVFRFQQR